MTDAWAVGNRPQWDHRLGHNKREWSPSRCFFLDTETGEERTEFGSHLPLRMWGVCEVWRDRPEGHEKRERWYFGKTGLELCKLLEDHVMTGKTSWLWAHNLGFDLATTRMPNHLPNLGWKWTRGTVLGESPWMSWSKGNRKLTAVDSLSHLPLALAKIGDRIGLPKLTMPKFSAPDSEWHTYMRRDIDVLKTAVMQYMDWWDDQHLGNMSVTGPATGWNCWRHTADRLQVHVESEPEVRSWGRKAIYGGRRSSWRVGELGEGPWIELDIRRAHLNIMRQEKTPVAVYGWVHDLDISHPLITSERAGVVADCVVRTETQRYPLLTDAGVLYPVGEFCTRLAGPELAEAQRRGELVSISKGLALALGRPMKDWADWVEGCLADAPESVPAAALVAMKGWSRTAVGKWAGRSSREVMRYPWPDSGWRVETGFYQAPDVEATTIYGSGEARTFVRDQESYDSFPAAYAWITSHMRVILGRLMALFKPEYVVACNTDAIVVHASALMSSPTDRIDELHSWLTAGLAAINATMAPYTVTVKNIAHTLRIRTPEHYELRDAFSSGRKIASVSRSAREVQPWVFEGDTWPGLVRQLSIDNSEGFHLIKRTVDVSKAVPLAWVTRSGEVVPPMVMVNDEGVNRVWPVSEFDDRFAERMVKTPQHPGLLALTV